MFTRRQSLGLLGGSASALLPLPAFANTPRFQYRLAPIQVADGIHMLEGSTDYFSLENGGAIVNCVLIETDLGIVIVDTGPSLRYGEALVELASQFSGQGTIALINTHHHPDHYFGNQAFGSIPIHGLATTQEQARLHGDGFADNMYRLLGDWMRGTEPIPPTHVIEGDTLTIGGRELKVLPLAGHSEADLVLLDVKTGTLISGDLTFYNRAATTPSADLAIWHQSLNTIEAEGASAIISGHGPVDYAGACITQTRDYLTWLEKTLYASANEGLDMVEIMNLDIAAPFDSLGSMPQEFHRSVSHLYPDIEKAVMPFSE